MEQVENKISDKNNEKHYIQIEHARPLGYD
jgi:hypothetical protein